MAAPRSEKEPDPLGKRALFSSAVVDANPADQADNPADQPADRPADRPDNPLADRGAFTVECQRCREVSRVGLLDMVIFQFPVGFWLPRRRFDHRMTCPACRARSWCSVTLRRH